MKQRSASMKCNVEIHTNDRIDAMVSKSVGKRITYRVVIA